VDSEISVEHAMITSSLPLVASTAREAERLAGELTALARRARPAARDIAEHLLSRADRALSYYRALATAAVAANRFLTEPDGAVHDAIDLLRRSEEACPSADDTCRSGLRAHRASLMGLAGQAGGEWLSVDCAKLIYVYPFGIRGVEAATVVERAGREGGGWLLAGVRPVGVRDWFGVDDMWEGADFHRRRFEGVVIELPPVVLEDTTGAFLDRLRAEVRLSRLGNHALRLQGELRDAGPQEVYAALRRAAPVHGEIRVTCNHNWKGEASVILFAAVVAVATGVGLIWAVVDR
jgi:hypothetical protein